MDEKVLNRVRGLLAKADSTEFPAEAESLRELAMRTMATFGIEQAMLDAGRAVKEEVTSIDIRFEDPFSNRKLSLLNAIGNALGCETLGHQAARGSARITHATIFGYPSVLEQVEFLYTSLLLQASRELARVGGDPKRIRTIRSGFLHGFAHRAGERLEAVYKKAAQEAEDSTPGAALVLVSRDDAVKAAFASAFPDIRMVTKRASSAAGFNAGRNAAERADLGQGRFGGRSKELTRG